MAEVVTLHRVSKRFTLHHERPRSFLELLTRRRAAAPAAHLWALRQVSLGLEAGETLGLIGPNGAGKSTLLKLVARTISPTEGRVQVNGRLSALVELGSGFHPDLSGRENVYVDGALLGLSRREVAARLDSIVEFAGLARFIDVPVRNYSSGMLMRLGFAVATSFRPDILLIDEVLAVGDQSFQARCLARIRQMQEEGTAILFVSHSLDQVRRLCRRVAWLDGGQLRAVGPADEVVDEYISQSGGSGEVLLLADGDEAGRARRWGSGEAVITAVELVAADGEPRRAFVPGETLVVRVHYRANRPVPRPAFGLAFHRADGLLLSGPNTTASGFEIDLLEGSGTVDCVVDDLPLLPGRYDLTAAIYDYHSVHPYDHRHRLCSFEVRPAAGPQEAGLVRLGCRWEHRPE